MTENAEGWSLVHEDGDIMVVDKLSPLPVQAEKSGDPALQDILRAHLAAKGEKDAAAILEAAHRIDRRASGAVIFAKTRRALETLEADFRAHRVGKRYIACVESEPPSSSGKLVNRLSWDKRKNIVRAFPADFEAAGMEAGEAQLGYRLVCRSERYFFLEVELITGRHHQIRAQLAAAGCPIRGDVKYGARRTTKNGLIMLHARKLDFTQPRSREALALVAAFPATEPLWGAFAES
ncbi:MAG TPA: RNA pseudouridine synthase [Rectinemataceae bacterium]|nr:RNA pseudouridine synthase [Rectinemataceae bacterium]